jgi:Glucose / Sorbosone dehydrogenase
MVIMMTFHSTSVVLCMAVVALVAASLPMLVYGSGTLHKKGFIEELVASQKGFTGAFIPHPKGDGFSPMLLIASKTGDVHVVPDPDNSIDTQLVLDISANLCTNGERGLQAVTPHPNFTQNYYIYMYYTLLRDECLEDPVYGAYNRLSR